MQFKYSVAGLVSAVSLMSQAAFAQGGLYTRLPRAFFEKPVHADVRIQSPQEGSWQTDISSVEWVEYPPVQQSVPASGQILADFSDSVSCADLTGVGQARLCFKVMGDVSNLGLNNRELVLRGAEAAGSASCASITPASSVKTETADGGPAPVYRLQSAETTGNTVALHFVAANGCGASVDLTLSQLP